jgi:antitoxin PrlF
MKYVATVTSKGQITLPQEVRARLGLRQGDRVAFEIRDGVTTVTPHPGDANPFAAYTGALGGFESKEAVAAWLADLRDDD